VDFGSGMRLTSRAGLCWIAQVSSLCGSRGAELAGQETLRRVRVTDGSPLLSSVEREYLLSVPSGYNGTVLPLLLYFHGWCDDWRCADCKWGAVGNAEGFISVKLRGKEDGDKGCPSWNVGHGGRSDVCRPKDTEPVQYTSCRRTNQTGPCNCYTCYDDVAFVAAVYDDIRHDLCVDEGRVFATGASNGAMFLYPLVAELAERGLGPRFKAIAPWYGAFFQHMERVLPSAARVSVFHSHGSLDTTIPPAGGESSDGYLYVPVQHTLDHFAKRHGCIAGQAWGRTQPKSDLPVQFAPTTQREAAEVGQDLHFAPQWPTVRTPWDGNGSLLECRAAPGCKEGRIVRCFYHADHGFWPSYAEEMTWWWFKSLGSSEIVV